MRVYGDKEDDHEEKQMYLLQTIKLIFSGSKE
jgi:hypothetical protein